MVKKREGYKRRQNELDLSRYKKTEEGLDEWQKEALHTNGNLSIRAGRQVGKSTVISRKAVNFALENKGVKVLIIAAAQREASFLFEKVRVELEQIEFNVFGEKPTQTKILLKNGSEIHALPTGRTGFLIRGQTIDLLIADEAAYIPELVWLSVIPMIVVSRTTRNFGWIWLLSTPFGNTGYFYESFRDPNFKNFHISSEDCPRIDKSFLEKEKRRLTSNQYRQEWGGEFIDSIDKFFPTELIKNCVVEEGKVYHFQSQSKSFPPSSKFFLGVDVARYGEDSNAFVVIELKENGIIRVREALTTERKALTETRVKIQDLNNKYSFNRIFIDDAGLGGGLVDELILRYRGKIVGLNNRSRSIMDKKKRILKEDLYSNTLLLMENKRIELIADVDLFRSLDSVRFEYTEERNIRIFGNNTHLAEALVRACWGEKEKGLNIFVHAF